MLLAPPPTAPLIPPMVPTRLNPADTDGNYFVNCQKLDGNVSSGMAYYKNLVPGQNIGQKPDDYLQVTHANYVQWEQPGVGKFIPPNPLNPFSSLSLHLLSPLSGNFSFNEPGNAMSVVSH
jgi:hypothetical protein